MKFLMALKALWWREIVRFTRQRSRWIGAMLTPIMFWIFVGGGFGDSFKNPGVVGTGYLSFFFPGTIALSVLFTAIFSTMTVIQDRHEGFLQGVLVAPVSRLVFVFSKILGGATLALVQGLLLLVLAPFVGYELTFIRVLEIIVLLFAMGASLTSLGFLAAWKLDSVQGYHGIMNTVLMPMWILSGAVFPMATSHTVFQWIMKCNPLTYAMTAMRDLFEGHDATTTMPLAILVLFVFGLITAGLSLKLVQDNQQPNT